MMQMEWLVRLVTNVEIDARRDRKTSQPNNLPLIHPVKDDVGGLFFFLAAFER